MVDGAQCERCVNLADWDLPVRSARYVEASRQEALGRLSIETVRDLLTHFPFRYIDLTDLVPLGSVRPGTEATVVGRVHDIKIKQPRPKLKIVEVAIVDGTGALMGVWFNQPFQANRFVLNERVAFAGMVAFDFGLKQIRNPFVEKLGDEDGAEEVARVVPVHRTTEGLSTNWVRRLIASAIEDVGEVPDFLPVDLRLRHDLVSLSTAIRDVHFPRNMHDADNARRRFAYDELLCIQLGMTMRRYHLTREQPGIAHVIDGPALRRLRQHMGVTPTGDQERAISEMLGDMASAHPANRLLLCDVGTGKTLVAAHALAAVADTGTQAAMMAPTEVLAVQYAEKVGPLLDAVGISWCLLTGSTSVADRKHALAGLESGDIAVAFGTHALLEARVKFAGLSLAIVDEQHRFGVSQRLLLRAKGPAADLIVMTATPIPRSLALTVYGDLAASYLKERPTSAPGRVTRLVTHAHRQEAYDSVRSAVARGRQAFVVCALVDESNAAQARAAVKEADRLRTRVFQELRVGLLTGRMRSDEKAATMSQFRAGQIDVLVSTTVIEVGIDVPNATIMLIEDAERFGLAQLHQLRGRVGRGEHAGEVLLFADPKSSESRQRMNAIVATEDGFELAEYDLRLRGEGQLLGERQHGLPELKIASLLDDLDLLGQAREDAQAIVQIDPHLSDPHHGPLLDEVIRRFGASWKWVSSG
ncbi:MAG: ATP-dependent DNA helicase RecG [Coriobacteriia bacterium]